MQFAESRCNGNKIFMSDLRYTFYAIHLIEMPSKEFRLNLKCKCAPDVPLYFIGQLRNCDYRIGLVSSAFKKCRYRSLDVCKCRDNRSADI